MIRQRFAVGVMFLVGCFTGGVAAQVVARPALAAPPAAVWEYWCVTVYEGDPTAMTAKLADAGKRGWELATVSDSVACLKRARR
jgi:hypothetical protein